MLDEDSSGPAQGEVHFYELGSTSPPVLTQIATYSAGSKSENGVLEPARDLLWLSIENESSLVALDITDGSVQEEIILGHHLEGLAWDPDEEGRLFLAGRLSNSLISTEIDAEELVLDEQAEISWASVPVLVDDTLWVFDQMNSRLEIIDPDSLMVKGSLTIPGDRSQKNLMFSDLRYHEERGTLFLSSGLTEELLEIDPDTATILEQWDLGFGSNPTLESRLEVLIDGDMVFVVRGSDGEIARIDLDSGEQDTADILEEHLSDLIRLQYAFVTNDGSLYFGPTAIDAETLEIDTAASRDWDFAFGAEDDCVLAYDRRGWVSGYDSDGDLLWSFDPQIPYSKQTPYLSWNSEWSAVLIQDMAGATVYAWQVEEACPVE